MHLLHLYEVHSMYERKTTTKLKPRGKAKEPASGRPHRVDPALSAKRSAAMKMFHAQKAMNKAMAEPLSDTATTDIPKPVTIREQPLTKVSNKSSNYLSRTRAYAAENSMQILAKLVHDATTLESARDRIAASRLVFEVAGLVGAGAQVAKQAPGDDLREYTADQIRDLIAKSVEREQSLIAQSDLISDIEMADNGVNSGIQADDDSNNSHLNELLTGGKLPTHTGKESRSDDQGALDADQSAIINPDPDPARDARTPTHPPGCEASIVIPDSPTKISTM